MVIKFSVDKIKNMDQLYTWTQVQFTELDCAKYIEYYHGDEYCNRIITDAMSTACWAEQKYLGSRERVANETFSLTSLDGGVYRVEFAINTYEKKVARLECTITAPETDNYDQKLEELKIALKNRLLSDWEECTWLMDAQSATLCKEAYEKAFVVENNLRAFASKVLIHFLGIDWIKRAGLEKEAESVNYLKKKFIQRVPEFDNINADFLSMTLETLVGILFDGIIYRNDVILSRENYDNIQKLATKGVSGSRIAEYIKARRIEDKKIWDDLFAPFIDNPESFKNAINHFIEDRNHVAHSKVLSQSAYQIMLKDFTTLDNLISTADSKFEEDEMSHEAMVTLDVLMELDTLMEKVTDSKAYYRERIESETGLDILDEQQIEDWFDEVLHELFNDIYQRYHLDVCYELSDFHTPDEDSICFSISSHVATDRSARADVIAEYSIDDDFGEDSICTIICKNGAGEEICKAEVRFHNGNGFEGGEGIMEVSEDSEYDTSEVDAFREDLLKYIDEDLNPYPAILDTLAYENNGAVEFVSDCACMQCGKFGISINAYFLPIGRCCYCGYENELCKCLRCGELVNADDLENSFCPSCAAYIDKL